VALTTRDQKVTPGAMGALLYLFCKTETVSPFSGWLVATFWGRGASLWVGSGI